MGLEYLKITPEIMLKISAYDEEAQGRLVLAMIAYALDGTEPGFDGLERLIWPTLKMDIDRCAASVDKQKANGSRGGRPPKGETQAKPKETQKNPDETQPEPTESLNTNTNSNSNTNNQKEEVVTRARAEAASAAADNGKVIGIDGTDLTGALADYDRAGDLVTAYKLPDTDQSRAALIEDAEKYGWEKVESALKAAALGNSRPMLSVNFYRKVLESEGKPRTARQAGGKAPEDKMLRYSAEERRKTYSAAVLDFDEEDAADG